MNVLLNIFIQPLEWFSERFNIFNDVDFSVLFSWMPADIQAVIGLLISFLFIYGLVGIIRRFFLL